MKTIAVLFILLLTASLAGCSQPATPETSPSTQATKEQLPPAIIDTVPQNTHTVENGQIDIDDLPDVPAGPTQPAPTQPSQPTIPGTEENDQTQTVPEATEEPATQPSQPTIELPAVDSDGYQNVVVRP